MSEMWNRVYWMKPVDTAILQLLSPPKPLKLTPSNIAINIEYDPGYVAKECKKMEERRLVKVEEDDGYPIYYTTDIGDKVADREISAQETIWHTALPEDYQIGDENGEE